MTGSTSSAPPGADSLADTVPVTSTTVSAATPGLPCEIAAFQVALAAAGGLAAQLTGTPRCVAGYAVATLVKQASFGSEDILAVFRAAEDAWSLIAVTVPQNCPGLAPANPGFPTELCP